MMRKCASRATSAVFGQSPLPTNTTVEIILTLTKKQNGTDQSGLHILEMTMKAFNIISPALICITLLSGCINVEDYEVYAIKFSDGGRIQAKDWVLGANLSDSVDVCNMFWLIRSRDGKNILVDAGFIDSTNSHKNYVRPDSVLNRLNV